MTATRVQKKVGHYDKGNRKLFCLCMPFAHFQFSSPFHCYHKVSAAIQLACDFLESFEPLGLWSIVLCA